LKKDGLQTLILHTGLMTYLLLTTNFFNLTSPWRIFHVNLDTSKRILSKQARSAAFRNYLYIARVGLTPAHGANTLWSLPRCNTGVFGM